MANPVLNQNLWGCLWKGKRISIGSVKPLNIVKPQSQFLGTMYDQCDHCFKRTHFWTPKRSASQVWSILVISFLGPNTYSLINGKWWKMRIGGWLSHNKSKCGKCSKSIKISGLSTGNIDTHSYSHEKVFNWPLRRCADSSIPTGPAGEDKRPLPVKASGGRVPRTQGWLEDLAESAGGSGWINLFMKVTVGVVHLPNTNRRTFFKSHLLLGWVVE